MAQRLEGEERLARRLHELVDPRGVLLLHDRCVRGGTGNIDHIAVGPGGVTVIDAKNYKGRVRVERRGGLVRPRVETLRINGRDRSRLVDGVERQMHTVRGALEAAGEERIDVMAALCLVAVDGLPLLSRLRVRDVLIDGPRRVAKLASRSGGLDASCVERVARALARALPPTA